MAQPDSKKKTKALHDLQETLNLKAARIKLQRRTQLQATNEARQRLLEEEARSHYLHRLLSKIFNGWRRTSWSNEWTLTVRANYHYKYHLYIKIWKAWQVHIIRQRVKRAKISVAVMQANYSTLKKHFGIWRSYIKECRLKKFRAEAAKSHLERAGIEHYFTLWKARLGLIRQGSRANRAANEHWASSQSRKFVKKWKDYVAYRRCKMIRQLNADNFYATNLLRRCIHQGFLPYTLHRRNRLQDKAAASEAYMERLTRKSFRSWHHRLEVKRHIAEKQEQIQNMGQRSRKRRILNHWKYYIRLCYEDRQNLRIAVLHHQQSLMRMTFSALHLRLVSQRLKVLQQENAHSFHRNQVLTHAWDHWAERLDDREELMILVDTQRARENFRVVLLRKSLAAWREYHRWRQHRKAQYRLAEAHFACCLSHRTMSALQDNVARQHWKRDYAELSQQFYREHTLAAAFSAWREGYHLSLDVRMMERMAILHKEKKLMQSAFRLWKRSTRDILVQQENMEAASQHLHRHVCQHYFDQWRQFVQDTKDSHRKEKLAERHHSKKVLCAAFASWTTYTGRSRSKATLQEKAGRHFQLVLFRQAFHHWKLYHSGWQEKLQTASIRSERHKAECMRRAFHNWRANMRVCADERRLELLATAHWKMHLMRRVVNAWNSYSLEHAVKATKKSEQIGLAVQHLNNEKLKRCFRTWRSKKEESTRESIMTRSAHAHYAKKTLKEALVRWIDFRKLQTKKMLLQQQCDWLNSTRLQAKYFLQWRRQYARSQMVQSQTNIALWHWSLVLQGRVVIAWHRYMLDRRRKKQRYEEAMNNRHRRLLETGISNWLRTTDALAERRAKSVEENHTKGATKTFHLVRRYALLWRQKTLANRVKAAAKHPAWIQKVPWIDEVIPQLSSSRRRPKRPNFLRDSLQTAGLWESLDETMATEDPRDDNDEEPLDTSHTNDIMQKIPQSHASSPDLSIGQSTRVDTASSVPDGDEPQIQSELPPRPPVSKPKRQPLLPPSAFMTRPPDGQPQRRGHKKTHPTQPSNGLLRPQSFQTQRLASPREEINDKEQARLGLGGIQSVDYDLGRESKDGNNDGIVGSVVRFGPSGNGYGVSGQSTDMLKHSEDYDSLSGDKPDSSGDAIRMAKLDGVPGAGISLLRHSDGTSTDRSSQEGNSWETTGTGTDHLSLIRNTTIGMDDSPSSSPDVDRSSTKTSTSHGCHMNGRREKAPGASESTKQRGESEVAGKVLRLKALLLEYQQLKQQSIILGDQEKVLMTILDDDNCESSLEEEYKLVNKDIEKVSDASRSLKLEITNLMKETGLQV